MYRKIDLSKPNIKDFHNCSRSENEWDRSICIGLTYQKLFNQKVPKLKQEMIIYVIDLFVDMNFLNWILIKYLCCITVKLVHCVMHFNCVLFQLWY